MEDLYRTVEVVAEGLYKEKGSKFLAFVYPVATEEQIREIITGIKEKYYDARHQSSLRLSGSGYSGGAGRDAPAWRFAKKN